MGQWLVDQLNSPRMYDSNMSDNLPNVLEQLHTAAPQSTTSGIADRTQELIDEVNRLLESSSAAAPKPSPAIERPSPVEPVKAVVNVNEPAQASPAASANPDITSFLNGLLSNAPQPTETNVAAAPAEATVAVPQTPVSTPEPETAAPAAINVPASEVSAPIAKAPPQVEAPPQAEAAPQAETEADSFAATDLAALFGFSSDNTEAQQSHQDSTSVAEPPAEIPASETPVLATNELESPTEVAAYDVLDSLRPASNEEVTVAAQATAEDLLTVHVETQSSISDESQLSESLNTDFGASVDSADRDGMAFEESSSAVDELREFVEGDGAIEDLDAFTSTEVEEEVATAESVTSVDDDNEAQANSDANESQSFTEKYLAQFGGSLEEENPSSSGPQSDYSATATAAAESTESPQATVESQPEPESAEMSVESWMASRFGKPEEEENEDEDESAASSESTSQSESKPAEEPSVPDAIATEGTPPFAAAEVEANAAVADAIFENQPQLEALVGRRLQELEIRIGQMFQSLSTQIESYSGVAAQPVALPAVQQPVEAVVVVDGENGEATVEQVPLTAEELSLQERLRKTEIELSISRAKVSQERNRLEQLQADLERREAAIEARLQGGAPGADASPDDKKSGLMDRWKRHLG